MCERCNARRRRKKVIDLRMQFLFLRLWYGINLCIAFVWCYNASIKFYTALCNSNSNSNGSRSIMENTWYTFGNVAVVALSTVICSWTHMGKEMMHHSPPHSPNYNLINTFLIFTLFHSHITAECAFCMRSAVCVCLFVCSFAHLFICCYVLHVSSLAENILPYYEIKWV